MSVVGDIFGVGGASSLIKDVVDKIWPDKTQAEKDQLTRDLQASQLAQALNQAQLEIDKIEAASPNWWVAGWRPGAGWICVFGLGYATVLSPLFTFIANLCGSTIPAPVLDTGTLTTLLLGLLGLGGLRTYEKRTNTQDNH